MHNTHKAESADELCADKISTNSQAKTLKIQLRVVNPTRRRRAPPTSNPSCRPLPSFRLLDLEKFIRHFSSASHSFLPPHNPPTMSYDDRANARPNLNDESDVEEEALVNDYREQVNYDDSMSELDRTTSLGGSQAQDLQAQLAAAATPLEYQATLETKFASYDNYCSLFHYILNSEGPVDLEVPSVGLLI